MNISKSLPSISGVRVENLIASISSLGIVAPLAATGTAAANVKLDQKQRNAGVQYMLRNSDHIDDLYYRNELNIEKIKNTDMTVSVLYANVEVKCAGLMNLNMQLAALPEVLKNVQKCASLMQKLEDSLRDTANALLILEDTMQMVEDRKKELIEREKKSQALLAERQKTFEEEFQKDLQVFKETGVVSSPRRTPEPNSTSTNELAEINLDLDDEDQQAFHDFLGSSYEQESSLESRGQDLSQWEEL